MPDKKKVNKPIGSLGAGSAEAARRLLSERQSRLDEMEEMLGISPAKKDTKKSK